MGHATGDLAAGRRPLYLNLPFFLVRAAVALGGWSVLAVLLAQGAAPPLLAGLGLAFLWPDISLVARRLDPLRRPSLRLDRFCGRHCHPADPLRARLGRARGARVPDDPPTGDLGSFLIAALLGVVYLALMSYVVAWYGDLPEKAAWYLRRSSGGWSWTIAAAVTVGAILPFAMLLRRSLRRSRRALRIAAGLILLGIWLHVTWLVAPAFRPGWLVAAITALVAMTGLSLGLMRTAVLQPGRSAAHVG